MTTSNVAQYTVKVFEKDGRWYGQLINNNAKAYNQLKEYYRFQSQDKAEAWAQEKIDSIKSYEARKAQKRKARANFKNPAKVGDILVCSWGYDQTNIDYYQVTKVLDKSVKIRPIGKQFVGSEPGSDIVKPVKNSFKGEEQLRRVAPGYMNEYIVRLSSFETAYPTDGTPDRQTDAWSGH